MVFAFVFVFVVVMLSSRSGISATPQSRMGFWNGETKGIPHSIPHIEGTCSPWNYMFLGNKRDWSNSNSNSNFICRIDGADKCSTRVVVDYLHSFSAYEYNI